MNDLIAPLVTTALVIASLALATRYERGYRRSEAAHRASLPDDTMAVAEAVQPAELAAVVAEGLIRDALATAEYLDSKALWLELDTYTPGER